MTEETTATESAETTENTEENNEGILSLREELEKNFNAVSEEATEVAEETEEEATEEEDTGEGEEEEAEEEIPTLKAPSSWKKEEKEIFDSLEPKVQEILSKYDKSRQADYTRKTQELAGQRKEIESLNGVIEPYKEAFNKIGVEPANYLKGLLDVDISLAKDPAGTLKQLISRFNVDPSDLGFTSNKEESDEEEEYLTDTELKLKRKVEELEKRLDSSSNKVDSFEKEKMASAESAQIERIFQDFSAAADEDGNILHPHFDNDEVKQEMSYYVGIGKTMEEAYKLSPTVKKLGLEASNVETAEQKIIKKRQEVAKAKKAGRRLKNSSTGDIDYSSLSLRDELAARFEETNTKRL